MGHSRDNEHEARQWDEISRDFAEFRLTKGYPEANDEALEAFQRDYKKYRFPFDEGRAKLLDRGVE